MIAPHAVVSLEAKIGSDVEIGPFCVIEPDVCIGNGCRLASHVTIKRGVVVGENNRFETGSTIGGLPQHITETEPFGRVEIGNNNVFRENTTVHRALKKTETTVIGNENYFMVNAHVAHDCKIGNNNVLVNNVMLGGHVQIGNRVNLGGGAAVHQFCRIGSLAMIGGQAHVVQDVPPFMMVDGLTSRIVGLNQIGLRRNGRTTEDIKVLKSAYLVLYRSGMIWRDILEMLKAEYAVGPAAEITQFLLETKRGFVSERHCSRSQLRIVEESNPDTDEISIIRANVG
jgi:UDP-N-acetylglucosamine acyltransferase